VLPGIFIHIDISKFFNNLGGRKMQGNPLREYLNDEQFRVLWENGFLNERAVRDFYIRQKFSLLKNERKPKEIINRLQQEFSYLSHETIRKIVYSREAGMEDISFG